MQLADLQTVILELRLMGSPFLGARHLTDDERITLRQAASLIQQMHDLGTELADALAALMDNPTETGQAFTALSHWHHRNPNPVTPTT